MKMDAKSTQRCKTCSPDILPRKKLRKTEERYAILECICSFPGHFDMCLLHQKLEEMNFHVSRATVYNTVDVLVDSGLIVRHQLTAQAVQYELRMLAETHLHLICMKCGAIRELKDANTKERCRSVEDIAFLLRNIMRFTFMAYVANVSTGFSGRSKNINIYIIYKR